MNTFARSATGAASIALDATLSGAVPSAVVDKCAAAAAAPVAAAPPPPGVGGSAAAVLAHEMSPEFAAEVTLHSSLIIIHTSLIALHRVISLHATRHIISFTRHRPYTTCLVGEL